MPKTLYEILGVPAQATQDEIARAYEARLAGNEASRTPDAGLRVALKEAHAVLSNAQRRAVYDNALKNRGQAQARQAARREEEAASGGFGKMPLVVLAVVVLVAGGWWAMKRSPKAAKAEVVRTEVTVVQGQEARAAPAPALDAGPELSAEQLYAQASQSVVRINVSRRDGSAVGHGSGVVLDADTVITNCHVALGGEVVQVRDTQQEGLSATVTVADEELDLCKLRVNGLGKRPANVSTAPLNVGQKVFAIGSPQGLDLTLSDGLVSSLREGPAGTYIQTTAPVSPGSSGGGLFDARGRLVGIITFQVRTGQNLNFALPVEWLDKMTDRKRDTGRAVASVGAGTQGAEAKPWLGAWQCFGPLTGRGVSLVFEANGTYSGSFDGKPIGGYYNISGKTLFLGGQGENTNFTIEELSAQRFVMTRGEGRRLACNR